MSREELDARIEAIRQRYLSERGHGQPSTREAVRAGE